MNTKTTFFEGSYVAQILGPLFLIPVLMLAGKYNPAVNVDLILIAGLGLLLCARKQTRGCVYALMLLALSATIKHAGVDSHHVFQACLESCVAFSLIITSLVFTEAAGSSVLLQEQMDKKTETIEFLEEDLAKQREKTAEESAIANHKLTERPVYKQLSTDANTPATPYSPVVCQESHPQSTPCGYNRQNSHLESSKRRCLGYRHFGGDDCLESHDK